jgi:hypothetical protein
MGALRKNLVASGVCLVFLSSNVYADGFFCDGQVKSIGLNNANGPLWVSYGTLGIQSICAIGSTQNGVQAETCRAWYAFLLTAHAQQKTIRVYYDSATPGNPTSCSGFGSWGNYSPYFLQTLD